MSESVGEILRKTRLKNNRSLEEASLSTRIRIEYLAALENNQRDLLPSEVQAKGFLRLYAGYLGLPADLLLSKWAGKEIDLDIEAEQPSQEDKETPQSTAYSMESTIEKTNATPLPSPPSPQVIPDSANRESHRIYLEIGLTLKQQRESLGLSLDEVENYIHIRKYYLEAIENGQLDRLPSLVQGRGMLNNYAKFLQFDPDVIMLKYASGLQAHRSEKASSPQALSKSLDKRKEPKQKTTRIRNT